MISGRTRTAEQRAAGVETREDTGMGTVAVAETEETAGTERRAVAEMEEVAAVKIVAAEETEEAAVAEIAEAAGDMAGDTEPAAAGPMVLFPDAGIPIIRIFFFFITYASLFCLSL